MRTRNSVTSVGIGAAILSSSALAAGYGWVVNILTLVHFNGTLAQAGFMEVLRVVGIFVAPLGAVLGYF